MQTDNKLQIGQVKWFGEKYFGFIRNYDDKEIFFHGRSAIDFDPLQLQFKDLRYDDVSDIVVYRIKPSKRKSNSVEAVDVRLLETLKCRDEVANIVFTLNIQPGNFLFEELALHYRALLAKDAVDPNDAYAELMKFDIFPNQTGQQQKKEKLIGFVSSILPQPHHAKFVEKLLADMTDEQAFNLYIRDYVKLLPRHYGEISRLWHDFPPEHREKIFDDAPPESDAFKNLFHERILLENDVQKPFQTFDLIKTLIDMNPEQGDYTINFVESKLHSPVLKTLLWIHDTSKTDIGINEISSAASIISNQDQQLLVKKLFQYIHLKTPIVTYQQLHEIPWTDISTWVALELLELCKNNNELKRNEVEKKVYNIVINHISNPKDTIDFHGFFDKCTGRKKCEYYDKYGKKISSPDEIEEGSYTREIIDYGRDDRLLDVTYCEGRKSEKRDAFGYEFWWCTNDKCYETAISERALHDYSDYTLWDFFSILGIEYSADSYQRLLGYLNRIKRFFERMHCRECKHLMHPVSNSQYAFYRVSRFICKNHDCENNDEVFLSHCINGRCRKIVDSRDSIKCKPRDSFPENFGWYICTHCFACCNTTGLKNRKKNLATIGKEYYGHLTGHKHNPDPEDENDNVQSVISCPQCAGLMDFSENEDPKNLLKWLEKEQNNRRIIHTYGKNERGRWWLVKESGFAPDRFKAFCDKVHTTGLKLSEADNPGSYFVAEPNDNISTLRLTCDSCSYELSGADIKIRWELRYHPIIEEKIFVPMFKSKDLNN